MTVDGRRQQAQKRADGDDNTDVAVELPLFPDGPTKQTSEIVSPSNSDQLASPPSPVSDVMPVPTPTRTGIIATSFSLEKGTNLGEYVIDAPIGEGGMGVVFLATHPMIGKKAAIKVLKPELCEDQLSVDRFIDEARVVNQIGHPNIVDIFAFGEMPDGRRYFVMEWLKGETLRERLRRGRMNLSEMCGVIRQLARALEAAHEKGIIHRDLKPENIFLVAVRDDLPHVKLLDFGVAKLNNDAHRMFKTGAGELVGTPMYISPEQARGGEGVDYRADIYSVGAIAFEMLCGRPPFLGKNTFEMVTQHLVEPPPVPSSLQPDLPEELDQLLLAMLAKAPADRPELDEARAVLDAINPGYTPLPRSSPLRLPTAGITGAAGLSAMSNAVSKANMSAVSHAAPASAVSAPLAVALDDGSGSIHATRSSGRGPIIALAVAGAVGVAALVFILMRDAGSTPPPPPKPAPVVDVHTDPPPVVDPKPAGEPERVDPPPRPAVPAVDPAAEARKKQEAARLKAEHDHAKHAPPPERVATAPAKGRVVLTLKGAAMATFSVEGKQTTGTRLDTQLTLGKHVIDYKGASGVWQHVTVTVVPKGVERQVEVQAPLREEPVKPPVDDDKLLLQPGTLKDKGKK